MSDREPAAFDALPCGVFLSDRDGVICQINRIWNAWVAEPVGGWVGRPVNDLLTPASRIFAQTHVWPTLLRDGKVDEVYLPVRGPGARALPMLVSARRRPVESGHGESYCWVFFPANERLRFEQDLLLARQRLENLVQSTDAGTWEWNVQTGEVRVNDRWAGILGWTLSELGQVSNQFRVDIAHPDELERTRQLLRDHFAGRSAAYINEARLRRRDGSWVWVQDRGRVVSRTPEGKPLWMFGIHIDISAIKRQEEDLRRSQALLARAKELTSVGGWELDLRSGSLYWSDQTCRIHGVAPGYEPTLEEALSFYPAEARASVEAAVNASMTSGAGLDLELPLVRGDGARLTVHALGRVEWEGRVPARLVGAFQDVTAQVQQQIQLRELTQRLAEQHELLRVTLHSIGDAVITTDVEGAVTWLNPVAERLTGWPHEEAYGRQVADVFRIVHEDTCLPAPDPVRTCLATGQVAGLAEKTVLVSRSGARFGIEDSAAPIRGKDDRTHGAVLVFHDVTEQRRLAGEMSYRATHDALTGLVNRAEFELRLARTLEHARRDDSQHVLLFLDLDQFKLVNDACGHASGDELLQQISRLLGQTVRASDTLARLGGDEFAVILDHCSGDQALRVASLICERVDSYRYVRGERRFRVGASIGLVPVDRRWKDMAALMQAADAACYAAKEAGRNRVQIWHDADQTLREHQGQMQWATRLPQALDEGRFVLYAQRIEALKPGEASGWRAEVLVRMLETDGSLIMPGAFLPAAERFKLATRVDRWVLARAMEVLDRVRSQASPGLLSVNLSGQSVCDLDFQSQTLRALADAGADVCARLCLEITESTAITNMGEASAFIEEVRRAGVRVALDDFGTGSSSYAYLKHLKVDELKIDGQFVRNLLSDPLDEVAVKSFVDVARILGIHTVAEFVDRPELAARLHVLGVDAAQGYFFHRPEPLETLCVGQAGA